MARALEYLSALAARARHHALKDHPAVDLYFRDVQISGGNIFGVAGGRLDELGHRLAPPLWQHGKERESVLYRLAAYEVGNEPDLAWRLAIV